MPAGLPEIRCGVDLIEVDRVRDAIERHGERFLRRIYTPEETAYCQRKALPWPSYAARFAAKEALFKSVPLRTLVWREIGVTRRASGAPSLAFSGGTAEGVAGWRFVLSLSHTRGLAIAQVIAIREA